MSEKSELNEGVLKRRDFLGMVAGGAATLTLPQWALAQMILGYAGASTHAANGDLQASAKVVDVLDVFFPEHLHFYYSNDKF